MLFRSRSQKALFLFLSVAEWTVYGGGLSGAHWMKVVHSEWRWYSLDGGCAHWIELVLAG